MLVIQVGKSPRATKKEVQDYGLIPKWRGNDLNWLGGELLAYYDYPIPFEHEQILYFDFRAMLSIEGS